MAGTDILSNAARSVTGAVTKAYIQFEDERISSKDITVTDVKARAAASPLGLSGIQNMSNLMQKAANSSNSMVSAVAKLGVSAAAKLTPQENVYEVKFNPSEINFQAYGGMKVQKMNFAAGEETEDNTVKIEFVEMKPRIMMQVPLIFDDCERTDAFMAEKFGDLTAAARTVVASGISMATGTTYSVRPQVEGFIAALRNEKTRKMTFFWGNLKYRGILESVRAEYTMFNMEGHPIRANVNLSMLLVDESVSDNQMGCWAESYQIAFAEDGSSLGSAVQNLGNITNIKL